MAFSFVASADNSASHGLTASVGAITRNADSFGNLWLHSDFSNNVLHAFAPDGTKLVDIDNGDLIDMIRAYVVANSVGSGWSATGAGGGTHLGILRDGDTTYLAVCGHIYQGGLTFYDTLALFETAVDGTLTCVGVTWTHIGYGVFDDLSVLRSMDICQDKTFDDPIVTWADESNHVSWGKIWPSVNTILAEQCCVFDSNRYIPTPSSISTDDFYDFGIGTMGVDMFAMPYEDGGTKTKLFFYINNYAQDANHDAGGTCPFLEDNYVAYPNGFMAEIDMGVVAEPVALAVGTGVSCGTITVTPTVAAGIFGSYDAFPDVATYFDGTTGTGSSVNDYYRAPFTRALGAGTYQVIWYQPFQWDNTLTTLTPVLGRLRVQTYDPVTGLFTDSQILQGTMATPAQIGGGGPSTVPGSIGVTNWTLYFDGTDLYLWTVNLGSASAVGPSQVWLVSWAPSPRRAQGYQRICRDA